MKVKENLYYPESYQKISDDKGKLQKDFNEFVDNQWNTFSSHNIVQIVSEYTQENKPKHTKWLGFILDTVKDNIIVATCNHIIKTLSVLDTHILHDIYEGEKLVGTDRYPVKNIILPKEYDKDLAFIICQKPILFNNHTAIIDHDLQDNLVAGFFRNKADDYSLYTWYLKDASQNIYNVLQKEGGKCRSKPVNFLEKDPKKQIYVEIDMLTKKGMSGGPIISKNGITGIHIWSSDNHARNLPSNSIVSHYEKNVKPLIK